MEGSRNRVCYCNEFKKNKELNQNAVNIIQQIAHSVNAWYSHILWEWTYNKHIQ